MLGPGEWTPGTMDKFPERSHIWEVIESWGGLPPESVIGEDSQLVASPWDWDKRWPSEGTDSAGDQH